MILAPEAAPARRIGIRNQGDGGIAQLQLMYSELGPPTGDINFVRIGDVGLAATALKDGKVDAFVTVDTVGDRIEAPGFPIRYLSLPPKYARLGSGWFGFRKSAIKEHRAQVVGEETGASHCQADNPTIGQEFVADWLQRKLS